MFKELKKWSERLMSRIRYSSPEAVLETDDSSEALDPRELPRPARDSSTNLKGFITGDITDTNCSMNNSTISDDENKAIFNKSQTKIDSEYCKCQNCKILFNEYAECAVCTEPLQTSSSRAEGATGGGGGGGISECTACGNVCCAQCSQKLTKCAFCRTPFITNSFPMFLNDRVRSLALERLLAKLELPCRNARYGCKEYLTLDVRLEHETNCPFSPLGCPYCNWHGETTHILQHLHDAHKMSVVPANGIDMEINDFRAKLKAANDKCRRYCISLLCHGNIYICKVIMHNNKLQLCFNQVSGKFSRNAEGFTDNRKFAAWIEISSAYKTLKGILPIFKSSHALIKQLEIPCEALFLHSSKKVENNLIRISITIRQFLS